MSLHKEINLEAEICQHLAAHGWLYSEANAADYNRALALFSPDVVCWLRTANPQALQTLPSIRTTSF